MNNQIVGNLVAKVRGMSRESVSRLILGAGGVILVIMLFNPPGDPGAADNLRYSPVDRQTACYVQWVVAWVGRMIAVVMITGLVWYFTRVKNPPEK